MTVEFAGLKLDTTSCGEAPTHCAACMHVQRPPRRAPIVIGVIVALIGLFLLTRDTTQLGLVLLGLGSVVAAIAYAVLQRRSQQNTRERPPVPVLARFHRVGLREHLEGTVVLGSEGDYRESITRVDGEVGVLGTFNNSERERLQLYRKKYRLGNQDDVDFHAGFVVLRGPSGLRIADGHAASGQDKTVLTLSGHTGAEPFLASDTYHGPGDWSVSRRTELLLPSNELALPVRLVPSLLPGAARRTLELELFWCKPRPSESPFEFERLERLEMNVPIAWGRVQETEPGATIAMPDETVASAPETTITWSRDSSHPERLDASHAKRRLVLRVTFENPIDSDSVIHGHLEAFFRSAISGITDANVFFPLGGPGAGENIGIETRVVIEFELHLNGLRYQDMRVVPASRSDSAAEDADDQTSATQSFQGVVPDHATVKHVADALSAQSDLYIKRLIEHPPRTGERADLVNRYWDLGGRKYIGVYPIDFHLVIMGEEVHRGDVRPIGGTTHFRLTVQGVYANQDMAKLIGNVWEGLNGVIGDALKHTPRVFESATEPDPESRHPIESGQPASRATEVDAPNRVAQLRLRKDQILDSLLAGRISEQIYERLLSDIQSELDSIQARA